MKRKKCFNLITTLFILPLMLNGQIDVSDSGNVGIGTTDPTEKLHVNSDKNATTLKAYNSGTFSNTHTYAGLFQNYSLAGSYKSSNGVLASVPVSDDRFCRGVLGSAYSSTPVDGGQAFGVYGQAGNSTSGYNYGVYGVLLGTQNGAAVYGSTTGGATIPGKYAGYFNGDVKVTGEVFASVFTPSDRSLKKNIKKMDKQKDKLNSLSGYTYKYTEELLISEEAKAAYNDTADVKIDYSDEDMLQRTHYGLIAQEVQEIYPELVMEGPNGKLAINYDGFIPVLIEANNDLRSELDEIRAELDDIRADLESIQDKGKSKISTRSSSVVLSEPTETEVETVATTANAVSVETKQISVEAVTSTPEVSETAALEQNHPNPFSETTTINYSLPETTNSATIYIYDINGKQLQTYPLEGLGNGSLEVNSGELYAGLFTYALVVDGVLIDSKQMILTQ